MPAGPSITFNKSVAFTMQESTPENKLRLLMIYAVTSPEKFEGDKGTKLMQVGIHPFPFTNNFKVFCVFMFSCTFSFLYAPLAVLLLCTSS